MLHAFAKEIGAYGWVKVNFHFFIMIEDNKNYKHFPEKIELIKDSVTYVSLAVIFFFGIV